MYCLLLATLHTQRNYGGSVTVIDSSTDRRNKGIIRHQSSSYRGGRIARQRGERKREETNIDTVQQKRSQPVVEELWDNNNNNDDAIVTIVTDTPGKHYYNLLIILIIINYYRSQLLFTITSSSL